jgi:hypothetical protein
LLWEFGFCRWLSGELASRSEQLRSTLRILLGTEPLTARTARLTREILNDVSKSFGRTCRILLPEHQRRQRKMG